MRIMHITDLHISLKTRPKAVQRLQLLPRDFQGVDYVVVSGDLADHGMRSEYTEVSTFIKDHLIKFVRKPDPARIIVVPGNHDIDWDCKIGDDVELTASEDDAKEYRRALAALGVPPEDNEFRYVQAQGSLTNVIKLDPSRYQKRFGNFFMFQQSLYKKREGHQPFPLDDSKAENHWSAHVFKDDHVVFYGLSTCHATDKHHTGACLSPDAINQVRDHAQTVGKDLLKIGVWHHGFTTARGHRDYLTFGDLSSLRSIGLDVGFHGHTHQDQIAESWQVVREYFPVFGTGSFSAEPSERPGGVRNQALLVDIDDAAFRWRLFDYLEDKARWVTDREQHWPRRPPERPRDAPRSSPCSYIEKHRRTVLLDSDGIAKVDVLLTDVKMAAPIPLACPLNGFNQIWGMEEAKAKVNDAEVRGPEVRLVDMDDGNRRFVATPDGTEAYSSLSWHYLMSNRFALDRVDAECGGAQYQRRLHLERDEDAYVYCVETPTNELTIDLVLPDNNALISAVRPIAQEPRRPSPPIPIWTDSLGELARMTTVGPKSGSGNKVSLVVSNPKVGYRYGFKYKLRADRPSLSHDAIGFLETTLKSCRDERGNTLADDLAKAMDAVIESVLNIKEGQAPAWVAHLWSDELSKLMTAFGRFAPSYWGSVFDYGAGIAGHAFRMRRAAVYKRLAQGAQVRPLPSTNLLYQPSAIPTKSYDWLVEVPILIAEREPAVGVLGMAGSDADAPRTEGERIVSDLANKLMRNPASTFATERLATLCENVSEVFWETMTALGYDFAKRTLEDHWLEEPDSVSGTT
jgi:predicted phosphodiesterase